MGQVTATGMGRSKGETMTPSEYARAWNKRVRDYEPRMKREVSALGQLAKSVSDRVLKQEIYDKPEDVRPSGKPKWRRTNLLAVSQTVDFAEDGYTVVLGNSADYAEPRHEANKPDRRKINPYRTAHWLDDTLQILSEEVPERLRRAQAEVFRGI